MTHKNLPRFRRTSEHAVLHLLFGIALGVGALVMFGLQARATAQSGLIHIGAMPDRPGEYRRSWAIVIGIDHYRDPSWPPLEFAGNDATAMFDLLHSEYGYDTSSMKLFLDDRSQRGAVAATQSAILAALDDWLPKVVDPRDSVIFFFAGHGDEAGKLLLVDTDSAMGKALRVDSLVDKLKKLKARHKALILDSCFAGLMFAETSASPVMPSSALVPVTATRGARAPSRATADSEGFLRVDDNIDYYMKRPAFFGLAAGRMTPVSDGQGENSHSIFTAQLLRALKENADSARRDHAFTFSQLATQIETRVGFALASHQLPLWGRLGAGDGDLIFRPRVQRRTPTEERVLHDRQSVYALAIEEADRALHEANIDRVRELLDSQRPMPGQEDLRSFDWYYLRGRILQPEILARTKLVHELVGPAKGLFAVIAEDGSEHHQIQLLDEKSGAERALLPYDVDAGGLQFTPEGDALIIAARSGKLLRHEIASGQLRTLFDAGSHPAHQVVVSASEQLIVAGGYGAEHDVLRSWRTNTFAEGPKLGLDGQVVKLALSPDGRTLVVVVLPRPALNKPGTELQIFDLHAGFAPLPSVYPAESNLSGWLTFSAKSDWLVNAGVANAVAFSLRDATLQPVPLLPPSLARKKLLVPTSLAAFSKDNLMATGYVNGVWLWDIASGRAFGPALAQSGALVGLLAAGSDSLLAALVTEPRLGASVIIRSGLDSLRGFGTLDGIAPYPSSPVLHQGDRLIQLSGGGADSWSLDGQQRIHSDQPIWTLYDSVAAAKDLFAIADGRAVRFFAATTNGVEPRGELPLGFAVQDLLLAASGRQLITRRLNQAGQAILEDWELAPQPALRSVNLLARHLLYSSPEMLNLAPKALSASADQLAVFVRSGSPEQSQPMLCQLPSGPCTRPFPALPGLLHAPTFDQSGRQLAAIWNRNQPFVGNAIVVWDLKTKTQQVLTENLYPSFFALDFSADGRTLAASEEDGTVRLFNVSTGKKLLELVTDHFPHVNTLDFVADESRLLCISNNGVSTFKVATEREVFADFERAYRASPEDRSAIRDLILGYWGLSRWQQRHGASPADLAETLRKGQSMLQLHRTSLRADEQMWFSAFDQELRVLRSGASELPLAP